MLTAAPPTLGFDGAPGLAALEQPVDVLVGPVDRDGTALGPDALRTYGYVVYRRLGAGDALDVWDGTDKRWRPEGTGDSVAAVSQLAYQAEEAEPWRGIIVAAGGRDADGKPQFEKAAGGYPLYSVRALFRSADPDEVLLTGPSDNVAFASVADKNLVVMGPGDGEEIAAATQARFQLRSPDLHTIGELRIERHIPGARVTLENAAGASIVLHPDGRIELAPAPGKPVVVSGDLETRHITYVPASGFGPVALP